MEAGSNPGCGNTTYINYNFLLAVIYNSFVYVESVLLADGGNVSVSAGSPVNFTCKLDNSHNNNIVWRRGYEVIILSIITTMKISITFQVCNNIKLLETSLKISAKSINI